MVCCDSNSCISWLLLVITLCLFVTTAQGEEPGEVGDRIGAEDSCYYAFNVELKRLIKFTKPMKWDPKCSWHFVGSKSCKPVLSCTGLKLQQSEGCSDQYLKISDGMGGESIHCGTANIKPTLASEGARDLFLEYSGDNGNYHSAFTCKVECIQPKSGGKDLAFHLPIINELKIDERCVCGLRNEDDRIVGGEDAKKKEFPWLSAVVKPDSRSPTCGAAVINDKFILTAAHCFAFSHSKPSEIDILTNAHLLDMTIVKEDITSSKELGAEGSIKSAGWNATSLSDAQDGAIRYEIAEIITHSLFTDKYDFDVALLRLKKKIDLSGASAPTPICLPTLADMEETYKGLIVTVAGWGLGDQNAGGSTRLLQKLNVPMITLDVCQKMMPQYQLTPRMLCAGFKEGIKDACTGDSGGPLIFQSKKTKQFTQIGIVSWGEGCAVANRPGVYSHITEFIQWIHYHTGRYNPRWCKATKG